MDKQDARPCRDDGILGADSAGKTHHHQHHPTLARAPDARKRRRPSEFTADPLTDTDLDYLPDDFAL
jgi:hypothetical protein